MSNGMDTASNQPPASSIVLYQTEDGRTRIECWFEGETLCLSQALMAELFQVSVSTINENIKALFSEGELSPGATIRSFRRVRSERKVEPRATIRPYRIVRFAVGRDVSRQGGQSCTFKAWRL